MSTDEKDYGYLASLLPPEGQAIYEANRIPAWQAYQAAIKPYADLPWFEVETYTKAYWRTYRQAVADAYAKATFEVAATKLEADLPLILEALTGKKAA
jgi:hypothetical protein